jgi:probable phosphoglycerate mutase
MIYVMRHGQSTVNVERRLTGSDYRGDLTALGREQAAKAAEWLADKGITRILYSPFHRAEQTAQIVGERLGILPCVDPGLCEMDAGDLHGRTDNEAWEYFRSIYERWKKRDWEAQYPGGETYRQGFDRYLQCLRQISPDETALLVTHGGITCSVLPYLCVNAAALQGDLTLDNTAFVVLEPYDDGRYICRSWNLSEHLEAR